MLRWIVGLTALCVVSAALGLGHVVQLASGTQNMLLALTALSGALLVCSCDAFETQSAVITESDDER